MTTKVPPLRYKDSEYQQDHDGLYLGQPKKSLQQTLPPGADQALFEKTIGEFVLAVGRQGVFTGEALQHYVDPYATAAVKLPCAAVCSADAHQLRAVLKVANDAMVPVWTFSREKTSATEGHQLVQVSG